MFSVVTFPIGEIESYKNLSCFSWYIWWPLLEIFHYCSSSLLAFSSLMFHIHVSREGICFSKALLGPAATDSWDNLSVYCGL